MKPVPGRYERHSAERGNMLFMILIAVGLIGALTAAIQSSNRPDSTGIDKETLVIRATEVQRYASELERAVLFIFRQNGKSESDIRFAHPDAHADYGDLSADGDPTDQVFHKDGGAARYRAPPADINDGSAWEFYGYTHLPEVGSNRPELIAVLPNVTLEFCRKINELNGQGAAQPTDSGSCLHGGAAARFDAGQQFYTVGGANTTDEGTFTTKPAPQACVQCGAAYHFYHVLFAR